MKRTAIADSLLVFILGSILIWPLFRLEYLDNWPSIESTFISDARMLAEHLPHPGWQPLWYCGTRFDYIYPPALRYGTALIAVAGHLTTARAYHLYTALLYVSGLLAVYWMVRIGAASRRAALLASAATALLSPSFALLRDIRLDSGHLVPQRLHVLMAYGEGPHISALCVLPAALAAALVALRGGKRAPLVAAGALCAFTVANNFYGATSLAICFPIMVWSVWNGERNWRVWTRAAAIVAFAYGLSAFWLTPSYLRLTASNLHWVAQQGTGVSLWIVLAAVAIFCAASVRFAGGRRDLEWTVFVAGTASMFSADVLGFYFFGFRTVGEPGRLIPELDLALILASVEFLRFVWNRPRWRVASALVVALAFAPSVKYLRHAWSPFPRSSPLESQYPYQITRWLHDHIPGERILPSGVVRFWFNAWNDNVQADGGSMQGMENQILPVATWQILAGERPDLAIAWLQALGTGAVVVPGPASLEHYRSDFRYPNKFRDVLPVLHDNGRDTIVYRVPRVHPGIGRIVEVGAMNAAQPIRGGDDMDRLAAYVSIVEKEQPPVTVTWQGFDRVAIQAKTSTGQSILLQETFDPAWRAYEDGKELPIRPDAVMGFMLIDVREGDHTIEMRFETPLENRVGQALFVICVFAAIGLCTLSARTRSVSQSAEERGPR